MDTYKPSTSITKLSLKPTISINQVTSINQITEVDPITESKVSQLKPKIKLTLKPTLIGKQLLLKIKSSPVTQLIHYDYNANRYKNIKRGNKPSLTTRRYTLSQIKYLVNKHKLNSTTLMSFQDPIFEKSIKYYFGTIERFAEKILI